MSRLAANPRHIFVPVYSRHTANDLGITLVELLVGLIVAGVMASAAGSVIIVQIQSSAKLELAQRQRDNTSRLDYLMQIEAGEASSIIESPTLPGNCPGTGVAAFRIPRDSGQYLDEGNASIVYYSNQGLDVWRCGPPVKRSGVLDHSPNLSTQAGIAVRDAQLEKVSCSGQVTNEEQLAFRLVFPTGYQPACAVARAKTLLICNSGDVCD